MVFNNKRKRRRKPIEARQRKKKRVDSESSLSTKAATSAPKTSPTAGLSPLSWSELIESGNRLRICIPNVMPLVDEMVRQKHNLGYIENFIAEMNFVDQGRQRRRPADKGGEGGIEGEGAENDARSTFSSSIALVDADMQENPRERERESEWLSMSMSYMSDQELNNTSLMKPEINDVTLNALFYSSMPMSLVDASPCFY